MSDHRYIAALMTDDSLPMNDTARTFWVKDLQNPLRYHLLPLLRVIQTFSLHICYYLKRLIPLQFSAHNFLQWLICFFMRWFVSPEANYLILRHMWVESQVINFIIANSKKRADVTPVTLFPQQVNDLMQHSFVHHDRELFRILEQLGPTRQEDWPVAADKIDFSALAPIAFAYNAEKKEHWTQFLDFETAHELFKVTFCFLLRADEYEAALNSLQFDQSLCIRVAKILRRSDALDLAHNRFPMVLHHTSAVSERFVLHGVCTEHLLALIEDERCRTPTTAAPTPSTAHQAA